MKEKGQELRDLEILSYDPVKKIHSASVFGNDGATWALTASFDNATSVEDFTVTGLDGKSTTCRNTWQFSSDRMAVSGNQECNDGSSWKVKGTKAKPAVNK